MEENKNAKYIVCFSGGGSSARVAIMAVRKYGKENVILLNHDISPEVEHEDIKRFKREVADHLGLPIIYENMEGWETKTPLKVVRELGAFTNGKGQALCTSRLKTEPFKKWLKENYPVKKGEIREDVVVLYGFDMNEPHRIQRRTDIMLQMGYKTDYPLAFWDEDEILETTEEIGIKRPIVYDLFKHANCIGCLKAGRQAWYMVYCTRPDIWEEAKEAEEEIGFSILKDIYLSELEDKFQRMKCKGIVPTEKIVPQTFWAMVRKELKDENWDAPCECSF